MRLGERLLQSGQLTATQLEQGLRTQSALSGRIGTNLIELGFVFADAVSKALAQQKGVPAARRKHFDAADPALRKLVPRHLAERLGAIPLAMATRFGRELVVAFQDPDDIEAVEEVSRYAGVKVRPSVAPEFYIIEYLERLYGVPPRRLLRTNLAGRSQPTAAFDGGPANTQLPQGETQFDLSLPASLAAQQTSSAGGFDAGTPSARHAATPIAQRNSEQRRRLATAELDAGWDSIGQFSLNDGDSIGSRAATGGEQTAGAPFGAETAPPPAASTPGPGLDAAFDSFPTPKALEAFEPFPEPKPPETFDAFPATKPPAALEPFPTPKPPEALQAFPTPKPPEASQFQGTGAFQAIEPFAAPEPDGTTDAETDAETETETETETEAEARRQTPVAADGRTSAPHATVATAAEEPRSSVPVADDPLALTAGEAFSAIERAVNRDQVADALIDYLRNASAGLVLVCRQGLALGWRGHAPGADTAALEALSIPLSVPSMFEFAHRQGSSFHGPPPDAGATIQGRLWKLLHCEPPDEVLVCPVTIGGRVVNLLYAHADGGLPPTMADELASLAKVAADSYVHLIKQRKQ